MRPERRGRARPERRSGPAQLGQPIVVDAEVVGDLVDDRHAHLADDVVLRAADAADRHAVDRDAVRHRERARRVAVGVVATGQRHAVVQAEQVAGPRVVLHEDGHVVHQPPQPFGDAIQGDADQLLEALRRDIDHDGPT